MGHRHLVAVDLVANTGADSIGRQMRDNLMAMEIEVDPMVSAAALRAVEQAPVEVARGSQVVDRKGNMKWRHRHGASLLAGSRSVG